MSNTHRVTFKEFRQSIVESQGDYIVKDYCNFIKDKKLRAECRKLYKKTPNNRTYGGGW